jgi:AcrR family transcriptional regulator
MAAKKNNLELDTNTEEKIKDAARKVFYSKGYAATRTRDIAEEAGINLALLNYYFRSKERLFEMIMIETLLGFFQQMSSVFNNEETSFDRKIELISSKYIDLMLKDPEVPLFILSELRASPDSFMQRLPVAQMIIKSSFINQYMDLVKQGKIKEKNPMHFIMNFMGIMLFPFAGSPLVKMMGNMKQDQFNALMEERKKLIPQWVSAIIYS